MPEELERPVSAPPVLEASSVKLMAPVPLSASLSLSGYELGSSTCLALMRRLSLEVGQVTLEVKAMAASMSRLTCPPAPETAPHPALVQPDLASEQLELAPLTFGLMSPSSSFSSLKSEINLVYSSNEDLLEPPTSMGGLLVADMVADLVMEQSQCRHSPICDEPGLDCSANVVAPELVPTPVAVPRRSERILARRLFSSKE